MIPHKSDWQKIDDYLLEFGKLSKEFITMIDERPVASRHLKLNSERLPSDGKNFSDVINELRSNVIPNLSGSRGGRYWGFVTGGATPIATFADWLVSTFDQNVSKGGDSVATEIERQTLNWLKDLFYLPEELQGILTTGATSANFLGAITARQFIGSQQGLNIAKDGLFKLDVNIFSTTPHASMVKSLGMAGFGQNQITRIDALDNSEAMNVDELEKALKRSNAKGKIVIASAATVTATDFDQLEEISVLCKMYNAWLHVDAAFGIFERMLNGPDGKTKGIELADSITLDCHKWLNVTYDCGVFFTRHKDQLYVSCNVSAPYLTQTNDEPDFMSLGIENSRRFRAFPVWLTLLAYGREGISDWVKKNIEHAKLLSEWIDNSSEFELMHPCNLNVVLFRPKSDGLTEIEQDNLTSTFLEKINNDGRLFLSPGKWKNRSIIRAAFSNWQTDERDLEIAKEAFIEIANNHL